MDFKQTSRRVFSGRNGKLSLMPPPDRSPVIESNVSDLSFTSIIDTSFQKADNGRATDEELLEHFEDIYLRWGKFGPEGDVLEIAELRFGHAYAYVLTSVGNLTFRKGGMATDILVIVKDQTGKRWLVCIERKYNPAKGCLAFPGGVIDVVGTTMEPPIITAMRELNEEIELEVVPEQEVSTSPVPTSLLVMVLGIGDGYLPARMESIGLFATDAHEECATTGTKRIYQTFAYALVLTMSSTLTADGVHALFKARDEVKKLVIIDDSRFDDIKNGSLAFGFAHHTAIFKEALRRELI